MTMRPFQSTISIEDARRIIHDAVRPIERVERVPLIESRGRVLAAAVQATADVPPFSRAAMDGYAVIARDLERASPASPASLTRIERIFTGQVPTRTVTPGTCAEVATGAPMPRGRRRRGDGRGDPVRRRRRRQRSWRPLEPGRTSAGRARTSAQARRCWQAGTELNASRIGALAALGLTTVEVYARPRVAILVDRQRDCGAGHGARRPASSTTSTASRCPPWWPSTAACRWSCARPPTPSRI